MPSWIRDAAGFLLLIIGCGLLIGGIVALRAHDYLGAVLLIGAGVSSTRGSVDLLRVTVGE